MASVGLVGSNGLLRSQQPSIAIGYKATHDLPSPYAPTGAIAAAVALSVRRLQHQAGDSAAAEKTAAE